MKIHTIIATLAGCLSIVLLSITCSNSKDNIDPPVIFKPKNDYDIYLLLGQSNMAGRAEITEAYKDTLDRVMLFKNEGGSAAWEKAANPLNKYSTVRKELNMQKLGLGYAFAKKMRTYFPSRTLGLVVNAMGGTTIDDWKPGKELYNEAVRRAKEASVDGTIKGILWHQGEGDYRLGETYLEELAEVVESFRTDLKSSTLPFVAGQIYPIDQARRDFNDILLNIASFIPHSRITSSNSTTSYDNLHFDAASQILLGERFADEMHRLVK